MLFLDLTLNSHLKGPIRLIRSTNTVEDSGQLIEYQQHL
jgi:hypothetical protein